MNCFALALLVSLCLGAYGTKRHCGRHEFSCNDGNCISIANWCDRVLHCRSGIDERFCHLRANKTHPVVCPNDMFQCKDMGCIPNKGVCDGIKSCKDGSDESNCTRNRSTESPRAKRFLADESFFEPDHYIDEEITARNWLLERRQNYAWGEDTERAIIALSISDEGLSTKNLDDKLTVAYLHLRIALALASNFSTYSLSQRALFINALTASCGDPRNFHGVDLVSDLMGSLEVVWSRSSYAFVPPIVYLTLCIHNESVPRAMDRLRPQMDRTNFRNDLKSYVLLTAVCHMMKEGQSDFLLDFRRSLVEQLTQSDAENIYELALITQALNAARVSTDHWKREEIMKSILKLQGEDGSFVDMLATYYVMPLLSGKTLLDIGSICDRNGLHNESSAFVVRRNAAEVIHINCVINFGKQREISQTMHLTLKKGSTILDVMEQLAQKTNENFRFGLEKRKSETLVYSIGGIPNDAERGLYWRAYHSRENDMRPIDLKTEIGLAEGDVITFSMEYLS